MGAIGSFEGGEVTESGLYFMKILLAAEVNGLDGAGPEAGKQVQKLSQRGKTAGFASVKNRGQIFWSTVKGWIQPSERQRWNGLYLST